MASPGEEGDVNLDDESDTESFVDALEALDVKDEKPVQFAGTSTLSDQNQVSSEHSPSQDESPGVGDTPNDAASKTNCDMKTDSSSGSDSCSNSDEEEKERTIDDLIKEATASETTEQSDITGNSETTGECCKDEDEVDEVARKEAEAAMSEEEKEAKREEAQVQKVEGNERFKAANYQGALESYTDALMLCPLDYTKDRSIMFSNRAATKYKLERHETAIEDCTKALELNPVYLKALLRRAELYEKTDKLDEALADYTKALEMDRTLIKARIACQTLPDQIKERNEKLKEEMLGKLKDLGNLILRPFGLSTNNFKLQQDPNTGGYSMQFQQGAAPEPSNGK
ncbi:hypothetical protein LSH36_887g02002 [Paralvinella palmiformis]|uniref:Tetratricopeptide repeat protein 1 n=1 Tax=Paralvinella palmiformis TaxID=53620 RepID=A0AAD9IYP0_9ANNE|nr:hypothetical protein LSH36_887g02002 [Paralvinella palmiformis]